MYLPANKGTYKVYHNNKEYWFDARKYSYFFVEKPQMLIVEEVADLNTQETSTEYYKFMGPVTLQFIPG